jgi:hypothetical protein
MIVENDCVTIFTTKALRTLSFNEERHCEGFSPEAISFK